MSNSLFSAALEAFLSRADLKALASEGWMVELRHGGRFRLCGADIPADYRPARALLVPVMDTEAKQRTAFHRARADYNLMSVQEEPETAVQRFMKRHNEKDQWRFE